MPVPVILSGESGVRRWRISLETNPKSCRLGLWQNRTFYLLRKDGNHILYSNRVAGIKFNALKSTEFVAIATNTSPPE